MNKLVLLIQLSTVILMMIVYLQIIDIAGAIQ